MWLMTSLKLRGGGGGGRGTDEIDQRNNGMFVGNRLIVYCITVLAPRIFINAPVSSLGENL